MRYVEITHVYVIPVPAEDVDSIDAIANQGVSIMENFMLGRAANIRNLHSDWKLMPKEYRPESNDEISFEPAKGLKKFTDTPRERDRIESLAMIEADADQGISFTRDIMGQDSKPPPHPWDQGLRITPPGHELFDAETVALAQENKLCGVTDGMYSATCVGVKGHAPGQHIWVNDAELPELSA
jgi:hypothetical protein